MMDRLIEICKLDKKLRKTFLEELIRAEDETGRRIDRNSLKRIDSGDPFEGINVWERAYIRYSDTLNEEKERIKELNEALTSGRTIKWEELVGFFGFLLGYHEYVVHPVRCDNLFDEGNSGYFFLDSARRFSGIKKKKRSPYFRGAIAFDNFCIAYYVAKNSNPEVESHFKEVKDDELNFSKKDDVGKALESARKIGKLLHTNPSKSFGEDIDAIYRYSKVLAERNPYENPVLLTISDVRPDKRIKRFQCRVAEGPLTPPIPKADLYKSEDILKWHVGITSQARSQVS